ncbi:MAG: DUF5320 domain-containing protein [Candidatus Methanofastidiosia archaeon]
MPGKDGTGPLWADRNRGMRRGAYSYGPQDRGFGQRGLNQRLGPRGVYCRRCFLDNIPILDRKEELERTKNILQEDLISIKKQLEELNEEKK